MTTERNTGKEGAAIDAADCDGDSLEDLTFAAVDDAKGSKETKEQQDVASHKFECVNDIVPISCETHANGDDNDLSSKSTNSTGGSLESIESNASRNLDKHTLKEGEFKKFFAESHHPSKLFDHKISRRRTIAGVTAIPKASSTKDLHRQTSEFGRHIPLKPLGNTSRSDEHPRETVSSRLRFAKGHVSHDLQECDGKTYVTPTQRKEMEMKTLKGEIKQLKKDVAERVEEIDLLKKNLDKEAADIIESKDLKIQEIRAELKTMTSCQDELKVSYDESLQKISSLEKTVNELKAAIAENDKKNGQIYYEMYRKGQESAKFERNFEIERLAAISGKSTSVTTRELLEKLMNTETELAKWQSFRRQESYEQADRPETEAAAILRFLKDSFYHYITDQKQSDNHLRAMIRIFNFTEPQKKRIASAIAERINKKNSL